ncbi:protein sel-1 homolog 3-like isoform X1 [Tubulanus polymorphus]|uniref:protein sel-1 homolog 3-like isoform X1 n=1 Tax=Tubulanus polymorphus TaxID=672921 RepID=UPI003DA562ED
MEKSHLFHKIFFIALFWSLTLSRPNNKPILPSKDSQEAAPTINDIPARDDGGGGGHREDSIEIVDPPKKFPFTEPIVVRYACSKTRVVGVDITASVDRSDAKQIFRYSWKCSQTRGETPATKLVELNVRAEYAYRPSFYNRRVASVVESAKLRAWVVDTELWPRIRTNPYRYGTANAFYKLGAVAPHERPLRSYACEAWDYSVMKSRKFWYLLRCNVQPEVLETVQYPVIMTGRNHGILRKYPEFTEPDLIKETDSSVPQFTLSIWLYVMQNCTIELCSIVSHVTDADIYLTPELFLTKAGRLHLQVDTFKKGFEAILTPFTVPKKEWFRIVLSLKNKEFKIGLHYGPEQNWKKYQSTAWAFQNPTKFYDTEGYFIFGGSQMVTGFKGYIGQANWYRGKYIDPNNILFPSPYHPMFELGVKQKRERCKSYLSFVRLRIIHNRERFARYIKKTSCPWTYEELMVKDDDTAAEQSNKKPNQCPMFKNVPYFYRLVNRLISNSVFSGKEPSLSTIGNALYENATDLIESRGIQMVKSAVPLLKQASCYGNLDAMYMLSVILNRGIAVKSDEIMAHAYLMYAALEENRFSLLALASKHLLGLDGLPQDTEMAYSYYKVMVDLTWRDRQEHSAKDVQTEFVRLTDEVLMKEQTDENGDVFQWIKHQAAQGVASARHQMAALYYWGAQGIQRNLEAAADVYRMGAERRDPQSLYNYGLVTLKGQGVKKDTKKAVELLQQSADLKNPGALNTLGWYAHNHERNIPKAAAYYDQAYRMGNVDAAHNLAYMYLNGQYPNHPVDRVKAFQLYEYAAVRNQFDAGTMMGYFFIRGFPGRKREPSLAAEWGRYISEHSPKLGYILRKAVNAYRQKEWETALFYYMLAAETGLEVANFNLGHMCENNYDGIVSYIEKDCVWRSFNISIQRQPHHINPYSLIKMGDYYWYGHHEPPNVTLAAERYGAAGAKGDPHALFNLATIVESGVQVPEYVWQHLRIPREVYKKNTTLMMELYSRCKESHQSEAYVPCKLALFKVQAMDMWSRYHTLIKLSSALGISVVTAVAMFGFGAHLRERRPEANTV